MISIEYEADMSSLSVRAKLVGEDKKLEDGLTSHSIPMTLCRF